MLGPKEKPTRILLAIIALLVAVPGAAQAADIVINNGLDCSNPGNVIDHTTHQNDTVYVRNVGCGTPDPWGKVASSVHPIDSAFSQGGGSYTGTITLVYAPSIPALPKWGYLALAGGLIVVGVVVMRRRAG